jgi:Aldo/keto reductase family
VPAAIPSKLHTRTPHLSHDENVRDVIVADPLRQVLDRDLGEARHRDGALDGVLQLPNVTWPGVGKQPLGGRRPEAGHLFARTPRELLDEGLGQHEHVAPAGAQRRHDDPDDVDAKIEILAEALLRDGRVEIAVRGGDDPDVEGDLSIPADGSHLALLQRPQQLGLHAERHVADLVEKQRPARGLSEQAGPVVWSPLAGGFLSGKYSHESAPRSGTRFAEAGQFVPFDRDRGERVMDAVKQIATRHAVSPARVALAWTLSRPTVSAVLVAARTPEHLEDNLAAIDLQLPPEDLQALNEVSDPGVPYPKWMVLQLDQAEDPRPRILDPEKFARGGPWRDLRRAPRG